MPYSPHNNFEDFFRTGYNIANTLTLTGGNEMIRGLFSFTNTITEGIVPTNGLERNNFNLRFDGNLNDKLSFDAKVTYFTQTVNNRLSTGDDFNNPMRAIYRQPSNISLEDAKNFEYFTMPMESGSRITGTRARTGVRTSTGCLYRTIREEKRDRIIAMGSLKYQFTDNLSLMVRTSLDQIYDVWSYKQYYNTFTIADAGNLNLQNNNSLETNTDFLLNYKNMWGGDTWSLTASIGGNMLYQKIRNTEYTDKQAAQAQLVCDHEYQPDPVGPGRLDEKKINSLYAFATLGFKSFLFLNATARNDWSSTLPKENWSYFYPSVGLTWVITDMLNVHFPAFCQWHQSGLIMLRWVMIRILTGSTRPIISVPVVQLGYAWRSGELTCRRSETRTDQITGNWDLTWHFFQNRLGIDFTWYKSNTFNQLIVDSAATTFRIHFGSSSMQGMSRTRGSSLTLSATPVIAGDFRWDLAFNYARNESEVIELPRT